MTTPKEVEELKSLVQKWMARADDWGNIVGELNQKFLLLEQERDRLTVELSVSEDARNWRSRVIKEEKERTTQAEDRERAAIAKVKALEDEIHIAHAFREKHLRNLRACMTRVWCWLLHGSFRRAAISNLGMLQIYCTRCEKERSL